MPFQESTPWEEITGKPVVGQAGGGPPIAEDTDFSGKLRKIMELDALFQQLQPDVSLPRAPVPEVQQPSGLRTGLSFGADMAGVLANMLAERHGRQPKQYQSTLGMLQQGVAGQQEAARAAEETNYQRTLDELKMNQGYPAYSSQAATFAFRDPEGPPKDPYQEAYDRTMGTEAAKFNAGIKYPGMDGGGGGADHERIGRWEYWQQHPEIHGDPVAMKIFAPGAESDPDAEMAQTIFTKIIASQWTPDVPAAIEATRQAMAGWQEILGGMQPPQPGATGAAAPPPVAPGSAEAVTQAGPFARAFEGDRPPAYNRLPVEQGGAQQPFNPMQQAQNPAEPQQMAPQQPAPPPGVPNVDLSGAVKILQYHAKKSPGQADRLIADWAKKFGHLVPGADPEEFARQAIEGP